MDPTKEKRASVPEPEWDVVVVGAGHNGLVAANYLVDAGLDVVVVEANDDIGGMTASTRPFPEAPDHVVNDYSIDLAYWFAFPPAHDLELHRHGLRTLEVDPPAVYLVPGEDASLAFWRDPRRTAEEIRYFSPADAEAYLEFARLLDAVLDVGLPLSMANPTRLEMRTISRVARGLVSHRTQAKDLVSFALASGAELISERFRHPVTRAALYCFASQTNPVRMGSTTLGFLTAAMVHRFPFQRAVGGMQALPEALNARLRARGGSVRTGARVAKIEIRGERATGVRLVDGTRITARHAVLLTCDPRTGLERLLPPGSLSPLLEDRVRAIPTNAAGYATLKVDMALSGRLRLSRYTRWRKDGLDLRKPAHFIGTPEGLERGYARAMAGELPERDEIGSFNVIPTAVDPSQAPEGQDTLYMWMMNFPAAPIIGWKQLKDAAGQAAVVRAADFYNDLPQLELARQVQTCDDIGERTGATGGCIVHVDLIPSRLGGSRPARGLGGFRLPVDGLYLGGAGSHPGGGVTGMPGWLASREIRRTIRRSNMRVHGGSDDTNS